MEELRWVVKNHPVIDNHAHNLLKQAYLDADNFLSITSEAQGDALNDAIHSLSHLRARRQLKQLYEYRGEDIQWDAILKARRAWLSQKDTLCRKCLKGVHTILIDDGLDAETVYPFDWHDQWTPGKTKRIVRIEVVAEKIMREQIAPVAPQSDAQRLDVENLDMFEDHFEHFTDSFRRVILEALNDDNVVGFKTVICYRSGLAVDLNNSPIRGNILSPFATWAVSSSRIPKSNCRLDSKPLNDWLVMLTMSILSNAENPNHRKPIQFHTGLGDNDMSLRLSNPTHLQSLIAQYPRVPIVLLHSSYPFTREAGYLATVYKNVYLDLGLVFPMISQSGQASILQQALELTPTSKLLYSSDGHWFPETYYLALVQFRDALEKALVQAVDDESLDTSDATQAAKDILFNNSNQLYRLNIELPDPMVPPGLAKDNISAVQSSSTSQTTISTPTQSPDLFAQFWRHNPRLSFVYVQWFDYMGTMRARVLPVEQFRRLANGDSKLGISSGNIGTLQNDFITSVVNTTGVMYVVPDLNSIRPTHHLDPLNCPKSGGEERTSATVMSSWCHETGAGLDACPRSRLSMTLEQLKREFDIEVTMGFEIELTLLHKSDTAAPDKPLTTTHAWSTLSTEQWKNLDILREIFDALGEIGVQVQQFHAESGPGQYEIILPPDKALSAIDTLLQARQVIRQLASTRNLYATLHPSFGNGAHAHISLATTKGSLAQSQNAETKHEWSFFAGILKHLRAVCALTLPQAESYDRVVDDHWAGGRWVAWGTQNRETPLRRVEPGHWEFRALDGMPNAYLALGAVLGAGLLGLRKGLEMKLLDCEPNPGRLTEAQLAELRITENLPLSVAESLEALRLDTQLADVMGHTLIGYYLVMKETEQEMLRAMSTEERRKWLIERY